MKVAYLGPEGSYTSDAVAEKFPQAKSVACATIEQVFTALSNNEVDRGVVPIENVIQGPVTETQDCLFSFNDRVRILDMLVLSINHALGGLASRNDVQVILSKDQALKQCSGFLQSQFPNARLVEVDSTSTAAARVKESADPSQAAIASVRALNRYKLNVLEKNIGNTAFNKTRFVVLGPVGEKTYSPTGSDATALAIYPPGDRIGILEEILAVVSRDHSLSLSSIHSRPDTRGAFRFYLELEGHVNDAAVASCIASLRRKLEEDLAEIRVFGSYPRCPFDDPTISTIGIVGGTGKMGQWFRQFFEKAGYQVLITSRSTSLSVEDCVAQSQAVIVNVPIDQSIELARRVGRLAKPGQLVLDNTSVKGQVVKALEESVADGVEVLGMHTIFGPTVESVRKRNVVFTRTDRSAEKAREFENIFYKHGARISYANALAHDQQMAFHQNLEHFSKIVLAKVLSEQVENTRETISYSSPNSRASLRTMARVLNIDPGLLTEIQAHNKQGIEMLQCYVATAQELLHVIEAGDHQALQAIIQSSLEALGADLLTDLRESE